MGRKVTFRGGRVISDTADCRCASTPRQALKVTFVGEHGACTCPECVAAVGPQGIALYGRRHAQASKPSKRGLLGLATSAPAGQVAPTPSLSARLREQFIRDQKKEKK
jgi:hypothetical protein